MKKLIVCLMALIMVFAFIACTAEPAETPAVDDPAKENAVPEKETEAEEEESAERLYIPVMAKGFQHQFWQAVASGAEQAAVDFDVDIFFDGP